MHFLSVLLLLDARFLRERFAVKLHTSLIASQYITGFLRDLSFGSYRAILCRSGSSEITKLFSASAKSSSRISSLNSGNVTCPVRIRRQFTALPMSKCKPTPHYACNSDRKATRG